MIIRGTEGTITGSIAKDQLKSGDYKCTLQFSDVPRYTLVELSLVTYDFPLQYHCVDAMCSNYLTIKGFAEDLNLFLPITKIVYGYRDNEGRISILPTFSDFADFNFELSYRGKEASVL